MTISLATRFCRLPKQELIVAQNIKNIISYSVAELRKAMKKIIFLFSLLALALFTSCDKKQSAIDDLESFSQELKENSFDYNNQDWEEAHEQYQLLVEQIDQYEYTDEELKEIGKLKAGCLKQMAKGAMKQFQDGIHNITKQMEGAIEEFRIDSE